MIDLPSNKTYSLGAGFRYSPYGPVYNPGAEYWAGVGKEMARRFPEAKPEAIWIVSRLDGEGTLLTFPSESKLPYISFSHDDENASALELFDQLNFRIWLQVEPGKAKVETLFEIILERYAHHSCVVGVGVDIEWHYSDKKAQGIPVGDDEAACWLAAARAYNPSYRLFLKHWETSMIPIKQRDGMLFVDDSQMFSTLDDMKLEFANWGRHFFPAPVAFQIGYPADKVWWCEFTDPAKTIGDGLLARIPNTTGLFWVDFSALEVFPP
ncbi:MAG TPA: hypothetical protein VF831_00825 [Anaerolineales bacterium]